MLVVTECCSHVVISDFILSQCIAAILFKNILICSIGALSMFTTAVSFFKLLFCSCNWLLNYIYQFKTFALKRRKFLKFVCKWHSVICAKKNYIQLASHYIQLAFLYQDTLTIQRHARNLFLENIFLLPTVTSAK